MKQRFFLALLCYGLMAVWPLPAGAVVEPLARPTEKVVKTTQKNTVTTDTVPKRSLVVRVAVVAAWVLVAAIGIFFLQGTFWLAIFGAYCVRVYIHFKKRRLNKEQPKLEKQERLSAVLTSAIIALGYPLLFIIIAILTALIGVFTAEVTIALLLLIPLLVSLFFLIRYFRKHTGYLWLAILTSTLLLLELMLTLLLIFTTFPIAPFLVLLLLGLTVFEGLIH